MTVLTQETAQPQPIQPLQYHLREFEPHFEYLRHLLWVSKWASVWDQVGWSASGLVESWAGQLE